MGSLQKQAEVDVRSCCLTEIKQTEEKYTETLEAIEKVLKLLPSPQRPDGVLSHNKQQKFFNSIIVTHLA